MTKVIDEKYLEKDEFSAASTINSEKLKLPSDSRILNDPNVWIADTGATCDSIPHKSGFINEKLAQIRDKITMSHVPSAKLKLLSLSKKMRQGWTLG